MMNKPDLGFYWHTCLYGKQRSLMLVLGSLCVHFYVCPSFGYMEGQKCSHIWSVSATSGPGPVTSVPKLADFYQRLLEKQMPHQFIWTGTKSAFH